MKFLWICKIFFYCCLTMVEINAEECSPKIDSFCYSFFNSTKGFSEAELACRQFFNGHLTSIPDILVNDLVGDYAIRYNMNKFWIGGNELTDPDKWTWTDGSGFDFNMWAQGEPDLLPGFQCIYVDTSTKLWYTQNCFKDLPYVCKIPADTYFSTPAGHASTGLPVTVTPQKGSTGSGSRSSSSGITTKSSSSGTAISTPGVISTNPSTSTSNQKHTDPTSKQPPTPTTSPPSTTVTPNLPPSTVSPGTVCEFGWIYFEPTHSCYKNTTNKYTLNDAEKVCTSAGAKLASVESAAEYAFFNQIMQYFWYWIGLCSNDNSKTWNWIDGKPLKFTKWCPGAPFLKASSCVVTNPKMFCFSNVEKFSPTYGMCKKPAINIPKKDIM